MAVTTGARCLDCPTPIQKGEHIVRMGLGIFRHLNCPPKEA